MGRRDLRECWRRKGDNENGMWRRRGWRVGKEAWEDIINENTGRDQADLEQQRDV